MAGKPSYEDLTRRIRELESRNKALEDTVRSLCENEERFRTLYENAPAMIASFGKKGSKTLWNKECATRLGWTEEEIASSSDPLSMVYPDRGLRECVVKDIRRSDGVFREYAVRAKDGTRRIQMWAHFRVPTGTIISLGYDITDMTSAQEALKKSEQHFRDLIENTPIGIAIVLDERVVYRNPEQQRIFGQLPEKEFPSLYDATTHPDDVESLRQYYEAAISGRLQHTGTEFRYLPTGDVNDTQDMKWIHFRATPVEYQGRKAVLFTMMDVTKTREMERLLHVQDRMASLGRVAAGIAHEIRNPLSGINIYLNALDKLYRRGDLERMEEVLVKIKAASAKIESVIKRVMDFSRPSEPRLVRTDINGPVEEALGLSAVMLRKSGIEVRTKLSTRLPLCLADPQLIEQVILNLINNAAEAMKDLHREKIIEIGTACTPGSILVTVSDSGPGIPEALRQRVFDPFYTTKNGSTGIGLSLSHRIVQDHGGTLSVSASRWAGAEFTLRLPVRERCAKTP